MKAFDQVIGFAVKNKGTLLKSAGLAILGGAVLGTLKYVGDRYELEEPMDYEETEVDEVPFDEAEEE